MRLLLMIMPMFAACDALDTGSYSGEPLLFVNFELDEISPYLVYGGVAHVVWEDGQRGFLGFPGDDFELAGGVLSEYPSPSRDSMIGRFQVVGEREGKRLTSRSYVEFRAPTGLTLFVDSPDAEVRACSDDASLLLGACTDDDSCAVAQQQLDDCPPSVVQVPLLSEGPAPTVHVWPAPYDSEDDLTRPANRIADVP